MLVPSRVPGPRPNTPAAPGLREAVYSSSRGSGCDVNRRPHRHRLWPEFPESLFVYSFLLFGALGEENERD
jgi:hypothetical protein